MYREHKKKICESECTMEERKINKRVWRGDSAICGTLCICQALAVLSTVSIIYLTVIIYLPSKRELESGIGETPVMCTTIERRKTEMHTQDCRMSSCTEWCLGKGGGPCDQIHVQVRQNGTDVDFEGCTEVHHKQCPVLNPKNAPEHNCKKDNQCTRMQGLFICNQGICTNITKVFSCAWKEETEESPLNCYYKRNCVTLDGEFICREGMCSRLLKGWECQRRCENIPTEGKNLLIMSGNSILTAYCRNGINSRNGEEIWEDSSMSPENLLVSSCTTLETQSDLVGVTDCINGSFIPRSKFNGMTNLTSIIQIYQENGVRGRFDQNNVADERARQTYLPFDFEITIYNKSLLYINHEGCVNTLQNECTRFYTNLGQDGRNQTSGSRFPCYYAAHNSEFVVSRYDLVKTKRIFLLFFTVPSILLIVSCSMLFLCSRVVGVTREGAMAMMSACCGNSKENNIAMKRLDEE